MYDYCKTNLLLAVCFNNFIVSSMKIAMLPKNVGAS